MRRLVVSLLFLTACTNPATQLVVTVDSDLAAAYVVAVHAVAVPGDSPGSLGVDSRFDLSGAGGPASFTLPLSFGVVPPGDDADRRVEIRVEALDGSGAPTVVRVARTGFVSGRTLHLPVFLADACRGVSCAPELTCDRGICVSAEVPVTDLHEVRPGTELSDGGPPPPRDGGPRVDAGPRDGGPSGPTVEALAFGWVLQGLEIPTASDPRTRVTSMCATPTGIALAGFTTLAANFGVDLASSTPISSGPSAIWVAHVATDGTVDWLRVLEGPGVVTTIDLVDDLLVMTGRFQGTFSFAPGSVTAVDTVDAFAAALELSTGATRWAASLGTNGGDDSGAGATATDVGVVVGSRSTTPSPIHIAATTPAMLVGDANGQGLIAVLDAATGSPVRAIGLGAASLEVLTVHSDGARGVIIGLGSAGRVTGLHPLVAGGGAHEIAVVRLDASAGWAWTTYLEGCTGTSSIRVTRNVGAVWAAFTDASCGALAVTLATPGGSRAGTPVDPARAGQVLVTLGLDGDDGAPIAASMRAVTLYSTGGRVGALTADGSDSLYVGGWIGLPAGGTMLDFGGGPATFTRNMSGTVQSNGSAFLWSHGVDGAFRGVDTWNAGGAGSIVDYSDIVTGIAIDATGLSIAGWVHGGGFFGALRVGGGTGYDVAFLAHAR